MNSTEVIIVQDRFTRSPFQVFVLLLCITSGATFALGKSESPAIGSVPEPYVMFWGYMLVIGSVMALVGSFWRGNLSTGMLIERSGLYAIGGSAIIFGIIVIIFAGWVGLLTATTTAGFGGFCFSQVKYINRVIDLYIAKLGSTDGSPA